MRSTEPYTCHCLDGSLVHHPSCPLRPITTLAAEVEAAEVEAWLASQDGAR